MVKIDLFIISLCGIVGHINLDSAFRLIFKDYIKLKKVEDTFTDLLDVITDEVIDITKSPIKMPKDVDEDSYHTLFISRDSLNTLYKIVYKIL